MKLEALLHYFHVTCEPAVAGLDEQARALLFANIDCVAAEAFITCKNYQTDLTKNLIAATLKFYEQMREHMRSHEPPPSDDEDPAPPKSATSSWISFAAAAVAAKARTPQKATRTTQVEEPRVIPQVIEFDHLTGAPINMRDSRAAPGQQQSAAEWVQLPWTHTLFVIFRHFTFHGLVCCIWYYFFVIGSPKSSIPKNIDECHNHVGPTSLAT